MASIFTYIADSVIAANKAILATTGIQLRNNTEYLKERLDNTPPVGSMAMWPYSAAPANWLLCDGSEVSATTYEALFDVALADVAAWGRGAGLGSFTVDTVTDEIILAGHGLAVDDVAYFTSDTVLPAGLAADSKYYVVAVNGADRFKVSDVKGGAATNITDTGTGIHSGWNKFKLPDTRGRSPLGVNDAGLPNGADAGLTVRNEGDRGGEEDHALTVAEMPGHTHTITSKYAGTLGGSSNVQGENNGNGTVTTNSTGGDGAHNTMHPFFTVNHIIYAGAA